MDISSVEKILADYPEVMGVWPNPVLATVVALCRDVRAKALDECEAITRRHMTYGLPDFPPAFNGGYRGCARAITDSIIALREKP